MKAHFTKYNLEFKYPSGTSRGILYFKETYFIHLEQEGKKAIGECGLFRGLSHDDTPDYEQKLQWVCQNISEGKEALMSFAKEFPSIKIGLDSVFKNLKEGAHLYFPSDFTEKKKPITINALIWMGDAQFMTTQIEEKIAQNFRCLKLKIGSNWESEKTIITQLRNIFSAEELEIRVDANGAFSPEKAKYILEDLESLKVHSIEQPIKAGQWQSMRDLCRNSPTPIALDEELIGVFGEKRDQLLSEIQPQYIILKPSLLGSFDDNDHWIDLAENLGIQWWITSALESNVGLNAISQYTATKNNPLPQGLGTGALYTNNTESVLELKANQLWFNGA